MPKNLNKKKKSLDNYARYSGMAIQMLVIIGVGIFGGVKLDEWVNWSFPVFTILLSFISVSLAIYSSIKDLL